MIYALQRGYIVVMKDNIRHPFRMTHVKGGIKTTKPVIFHNEDSAKSLKMVLDVAVSINGTWDDAVEMKDGDIVVDPDINVETNKWYIDFEYCEVKEIDVKNDISEWHVSQ